MDIELTVQEHLNQARSLIQAHKEVILDFATLTPEAFEAFKKEHDEILAHFLACRKELSAIKEEVAFTKAEVTPLANELKARKKATKLGLENSSPISDELLKHVLDAFKEDASNAKFAKDMFGVTYDPSLVDQKIILSVRNLKQFFGTGPYKNKAVHNISFDVKEGECFGLVGESGCGKTTTGRTVIGLYQPTGGAIYYKGFRIAAGDRWNRKEIKWSKIHANEEIRILTQNYKNDIAATSVQMIFQDPIDSLDPRMTVEDIISEGLKIQGNHNRQENQLAVAQALSKVGLIPEYASRYPHEFSGGQRQRIGIARAMIMNPKVLICDEPISALDVSIRAQVLNLLNKLKQEMGLTMIFIAHDLSVVKYFCDRIAVMYFGNMVELASSDELFAHPLHPYTKALLSAIPKPDPLSEKQRTREIYNPTLAHDYSESKPTFREILPGHFVLCNDAEEAAYKKEIAALDQEREGK